MAQITLGGTPCNTNGELPQKGDTIPNFTLVKSDMSPIELDSLRGKRVILNIFPSVDTAVCAASVRKFNEHAAQMDNTVVLNVSQDLPFAQARFCGAEGIDNAITASSFRTPEFAEKLGVGIADGGFQGLHARSVIALDEEGKVIYTQLVNEVGDEPDYESVLKSVNS
jgi:thiol peroxidase